MLNRRIPFYRQLISFASIGFAALDTESQADVKKFILQQQSGSGGFVDRAGNPDMYYTFFGFFLSEATDLTTTKTGLQTYIKEQQNIVENSLINKCCLAIIEKDNSGRTLQKIVILTAILNHFLSGAGDINRSYQYFMVFMALDAYGLNNCVTRIPARYIFKKQIAQADLPCPVVAAMLVLKSNLGLSVDTEHKLLMSFFDEERGFKAFSGAPATDLLSTAVALVALKLTNADLRMVRPACLKLVEENFESGAFLAGNGDWERDTEYTFYGLTALGLLT